MKKKYRLTDEIQVINGKTLYRIQALKNFYAKGYLKWVRKNELGGWVESEKNLSQEETCWIAENACVFDNAKVYKNACVLGNAKVYENAEIYGNAKVYENAEIYGNAKVYENAWICDNVKIFDNVKISNTAWVGGYGEMYGDTCIHTNDIIFWKTIRND
jgi:UDP-3-O-[3-hydroxymyristoyl] glucosamine N-acyltransferase